MDKSEVIVPDNYEDIINLPYPRNDWNFLIKHPRMSIENRAKIFAPFAALRGHSDAIAETAEKKLTIRQEELMEDSRIELDEALAALSERLQRGEHPTIRVSYFVQDKILAAGVGTYREIEGLAAKLDLNTATLQVVDTKIPLNDIQWIKFA